jgi:hypothetical protein
MNTHRISDVTVLNDQLEVPGIGLLPVNACRIPEPDPDGTAQTQAA